MRYLILTVSFLLGLIMISVNDTHADENINQETAHDFEFTSIEGDPLPLSEFKDNVLLIVNTASFCGFTDQYRALEKLYQEHKDQGFVVIGVPSDSFNQEHKTDEDVKEFCEMNYQITFPLTSIEKVKGKDAHPFYQWAAEQKKGGFLSSSPKWNFHKYIVGKNGGLIGSFGAMTKPDSKKIKDILLREITHGIKE